MKIAATQNIFSFSANKKVGNNCCPKPHFTANTPSYNEIVKENAVLKQALRDASRIIAQDMFVKKSK